MKFIAEKFELNDWEAVNIDRRDKLLILPIKTQYYIKLFPIAENMSLCAFMECTTLAVNNSLVYVIY